jgi:protease-4
MRKLLWWIGIIIGIVLIFVTIIYFAFSAFLDNEPYIADESYIEYDIWGSVPEYSASDALEEYFSGSVLDMVKIRRTLKIAAVDDRIQGIILNISFFQGGYAKIEEIREMINEFKSSGKKVFAYLDIATTRDYLLASSCDSVYLQPGGTIILTGLSAEVTFYKDLLNKVGIEADFEHIGKYKSYPEAYTRQNMSDPQREVINDILDNRYEYLISTIAVNRNITEDRVDYLINNITGFTGDEARQMGLIDGLRFKNELPGILTNNTRVLSKVSALNYSKINPRDLGLEKGPRFAVIFCSGTITGGEDGDDPIFGGTMGADRVIRNIESAAKNKSIKAIILRIDSPGGSGIDSEKIWKAVIEAAKEKPVIASISDLGASGGYYIAIGADTVIAESTSLIGSIGVFIGKFSLENLYHKLGINVESIQRGKNARLFSLVKTFSPDERAIVKKLIADSYDDFINRVAENRKKSAEEINRIAQGRVWTGQEGAALGLVDTLGGLDMAIKIAKEKADIATDVDIHLILYPKRKSFLNSIFRYIAILHKSPLEDVRRLERCIENIQSRVLAIMPFRINFN